MQDITKVVDSLEVRLKCLIGKYTALKSENDALKERVITLENDLQNKDLSLISQNIELESLRIAKTIKGSEYSKETTHKINALVKEIDWCISQLSD